jgi:4-aminobutyrate aminotransferase / (S)-3-amino-2-methylpropionate transaminase / 5-aminovalerate transaminase
MTAVETAVGGPHLHQARRLVTEVPGPRSLELAARRRSAVPAGLTSSAGVYAAAAGGGVLVDVDGNSFNRPGQRHRSHHGR